MFTQPINQSGLSGFIPVRRQEGGVPNQELDIGQIAEFDIFGRAIPKTTTNIGQIENPQQLAPGLPQGGISSLIPVDGGADDPFVDAPDFTPPDVDVSLDTVTEGVSNLAEDISGKVSGAFEGKDGSFAKSPVAGGLVGAFAKATTNTALAPTLGRFAGPLGGFLGEFASQAIQGKDFDFAEMGLQAGLGLLSVAFPPLAIPIMLFNLVRSFWGEDEGAEGPGVGSAPGSGVDAATSGLGIGIEGMPGITGPGFDETSGPFGSVPDVGPASGISPGSPGFGGFGDTGAMGGPSAPDGPGAGDADGDGGSDGAGAPGCWVAGTKVLMADSTYCNIEDLKIGDMVMSFPETKKTRRWNTPLEPQPIISLLVDVHPEIWHLNDSMVSGTEWIIKGDGTAAIVQWLNIGDTVLGPDNNLIEVTRVEPAEGELKKQVIYNFETKFNYSYTANNMRTIRGRAVRAPERGPWSEEYLAGDTNAYEGSMQDEYDKKFKTYTS